MKKILVLCYTDAKNDPRVYRQLLALRDTYDITVVGLGDPQMEGVDFYPVTGFPPKSVGEKAIRALGLLTGEYRHYLRRRYAFSAAIPQETAYDAVIVNDLEPLPLGFILAKGAPVIFDAHEYYPEQLGTVGWNTFFKRPVYNLCRELIPQCAAMMTVSPGIAVRYEQEFGVSPSVVYNVPLYHDVSIQETNPAQIRIIHHGAALPGRKIENMIEVLEHLDARFSLDLMLVPLDKKYLDKLKERAQKKSRLRILDPVPMREIVNTIKAYDIGMFLLECNTFNHTHALANKVFEFIQARLCLAVSPTPGMHSFVKETGVGVVASDFLPQSLAGALNALGAEDVMGYKCASDRMARKFTSENAMEVIRSIVTGVTENTTRL
ncbi:glycosyltransferase [Desulfovibrio sp. OttesenSCG-928-O18]|nr:glycosyltransferase [Desulfovibrio sp. OttesenSCG-928-O18]